MADVTVVKDSYRWTFDLTRDGDTTTRTISMDNAKTDEAGLSAAKAFRDMFSGAASSPLTIIDPQTFIQPSGWRDNNPNEAPWTTTDCNLAMIKETTTYYEGSGGSGEELNIEAGIAETGIVRRNGNGAIKMFTTTGSSIEVDDPTQASYSTFNDEGLNVGDTVIVVVAAGSGYPAGSATVTLTDMY